MCGICESHIDDTVSKHFSVKKFTSSHNKGIAEIISDMPLDENLLCKEIDNTGYKVLSVSTQPYEKKSFVFSEKNNNLQKTAKKFFSAVFCRIKFKNHGNALEQPVPIYIHF